MNKKSNYKLQNDLVNKLSLSADDSRIIIETLELLFPQKGVAPNLSIRHRENFHRYFGNNLFEADLSEAEFLEILKSDISRKTDLIKDLITKGKSGDLRVRVRSYENYNSKEDLIQLIYTWVILFNETAESSNEIFLLRMKEAASKGFFTVEEFKSFFLSLFDPSKAIHFKQTYILRDILRHYIKDSGYNFVVSKEEAQLAALDRLKGHLTSIPAIDEQTFKYYYNCYENIDESNRVVLMPAASEEISKKINESPLAYLKFIVRPQYKPHDGSTYVFEPFIPSYFGGWDKFETFLQEISFQDRSAVTLLKYLQDFRNSGYQFFITKESIRWLRIKDDGSSEFINADPEPPVSPNEDLSRNIEVIINKKIEDYNSFNFKKATNVKVGQYEIDILLTAFNNAKFNDRLIEIKFLNDTLSMERIREALRHLTKARSHYQQTSGKRAIAILVIVYNLSPVKLDQIERFEKAIAELQAEVGASNFPIILIKSILLREFDARQLLGE